eukprot:TRINITY_DN4920_c0_g3_i1.p1 TRINITY_DN4920_c0_g3~~TRINITY_DN4920_c0_g3_i1.p1  ORF type:complete len:522 (-),score=114.07 TRINITY_DN4920_c0_g3_i1:322-1725(-)
MFARLEYLAKEIEATYPGIFFHYEMKNPPAWKEFIMNVYNKYDFRGYSDDFPGPLIWTHEGHLVGGATEFVDEVCVKKLGMQTQRNPADPLFKAIAQDNLQQVRQELQRQTNGPGFAELAEERAREAQAAGLVEVAVFEERRKILKAGARLETWISQTLAEERAQQRATLGEGQGARVPSGLVVCNVGAEASHLALLHPKPLARGQLCLVKDRVVKRLEEPAGEIEVPLTQFGRDPEEDLGLEDFTAAAEALLAVKGVATWMGFSRGAEYRHPLDTHIQVLTLPLGAEDEGGPRFPLELQIERAVREKSSTLAALPFRHTLVAVNGAKASDLAFSLLKAYESLRGGKCGSCMLAFGTSWLLYAPLSEPPTPSDLRYETWLRLPPPPPCALLGVVVSEAIDVFTQTCGVGSETGAQLVTNRAALEGIPEEWADEERTRYTEAYEAALRDPRVNARILDEPMALVSTWA